jgi:hypothetical protein
VKPFKEEILIEKCGRIIELRSLADSKAISGAPNILLVGAEPANGA